MKTVFVLQACFISGFVLLGNGQTVAAAQSEVAPCTLPIVVRATLVAEGMPEWSSAMIYHQEGRYSKSYSVHSGANRVAPGIFLREIHKLAVIVDNHGSLERCLAKGHTFKGTPPVPAKTAPLSYRSEPTKIDASSVPSRLKDILEELAEAEKAGPSGIGGPPREGVKAAWTDKFVVPGLSGGPDSQKAFQVGRLQKDSIYYKLGIRNFDVVRTVNGHPISSPDEATKLLEQLGDASALKLGVHRRGKPVEIDVQLGE